MKIRALRLNLTACVTIVLLCGPFALHSHAETARPLQEFEDVTLVQSEDNDGDSFRVLMDGKEQTVRLYFVDSPETTALSGTDARRIRAQTRYFGLPDHSHTIGFGKKAREFKEEQLEEPFTVHTSFATAPGRSTSRRIYVFVTTALGEDLAALLVGTGLARAYGIGRSTPSSVSRDEQAEMLSDLEMSAAMKRVGIWSVSDPDRIVVLRAEQRREEAELEKITDALHGPVSPDEPIDLNTSSATDLARLPGIGGATARKIIKKRPFDHVDDLLSVSGIGRQTLDKIRPLVKVQATP
ncbi:MAG: helix-hairpin-helix domain-containing protein [Lentisphaerae bacterium]|nr:helix-hairpin-helix domain-containing protein [Lentisphaerota bacterium]